MYITYVTYDIHIYIYSIHHSVQLTYIHKYTAIYDDIPGFIEWFIYIYIGYRNMLSIQCRNHETKERIAPWGDDLLGRSLAPKKGLNRPAKCPLFKLMFLIFFGGCHIYIYLYILSYILYIIYIIYIYMSETYIYTCRCPKHETIDINENKSEVWYIHI